MKGRAFTKQEIIRYKNMFVEMYEVSNGVYTTAINKLNENFPDVKVSWHNQYYKWMKDDIDFKTKLELIDIRRTAWVENKLLENIELGYFPAIQFYLKAKAGWSEKSEQTINHNINEPIKITIVKPDGEHK